jgi:hypothetical protein
MRWLLLLAAMSAPVLPLFAQTPPVVALGQKVRLRLPAGNGKYLPRFDGTIVGIAGDTLTLRPSVGGGSRLYGRSNESQLMVLTGHQPAVLRGATIGALIGVLSAGFVATLTGPSCTGNDVLCFIHRPVALRNAAVLGGVGLAAGAAIGALSPRKIWARAWLPRVEGTPGGGAGGFSLGVSIAF